MKSVIAFACLLAVASAGYINAPVISAPLAYAVENDGSYKGEGLYESTYKGEGLLESLDYNAPVAVAARVAVAAPVAVAARVAVAAPVVSASKAVAYNAPLVSAPHPVPVAAPVVHTYAAPIAHTYAAPVVSTYAHALPLASEARLVDPVAIAAGAPLPTGDTVEVAAAKAAHLQAHAAAKGIAVPVATTYAGHYAHAYAAPVVHAAHGVALASEARLVDPVAIAAGAPLPSGDTVEVAAAKAFHHAAHHEAKKTHLLAKGHIIAKRSPVFIGAPLAYTSPIHSYGYSTIAAPLAYSAYGYGRYFL